MVVSKVLSNLRVNTLPNITTNRQMGDEDLINIINEGVFTLHSMFNIRFEQAIILAPAFRTTFKINNSDPNVIMASYAKLAECSIKAEYKSKSELIKAALELDKNLKSNILLSNNEQNKEIFKTKHDQVMNILSVSSDDLREKFIINQENVFAIDQETLFFPHIKESDVIYVKYKPKPILSLVSALDEELDLPDTLLDALYSFVTLKIITGLSGIEGIRQFYPSVLSAYNQEIQKARTSGAIIPQSWEMNDLKGFI